MNSSVAAEKSTQTTHHSINGGNITIRPIKQTDIFLEKDFIHNLSAEAKHYRFLGGVSELSNAQLTKLCDVDYHDSMAFVAIAKDNDTELEIGVARYCKADLKEQHELALVVADKYRHSGLSELLLNTLVDYARKHNVKSLYSMELYDNQDMKDLAHKFGMNAVADPDDVHQIIYTLDL